MVGLRPWISVSSARPSGPRLTIMLSTWDAAMTVTWVWAYMASDTSTRRISCRSLAPSGCPPTVMATVVSLTWHPVLPGSGYGAFVPDVLAVEDGRRWRYISPVGGEPAIVVERRKELTYLLCQAAELEHALMCQYLYAAFSLKSTAGPGLRSD
jgi:Ferritin-like